MSRTKKLAFSGVFTALCLVFLYVGSLFQTLDLSSAAIASIVILFALTEFGKSWAFGIFLASGAMSLLLLPNKSAAVIYVAFVGYYPILKVYLNRIRPKWLSYLARLSCFIPIMLALMFLAKIMLFAELEAEEFEFIIYPLACAAFVLYDFALERLVLFYNLRIKPKLFGTR